MLFLAGRSAREDKRSEAERSRERTLLVVANHEYNGHHQNSSKTLMASSRFA